MAEPMLPARKLRLSRKVDRCRRSDGSTLSIREIGLEDECSSCFQPANVSGKMSIYEFLLSGNMDLPGYPHRSNTRPKKGKLSWFRNSRLVL